jgi:hypothetical protein
MKIFKKDSKDGTVHTALIKKTNLKELLEFLEC